MSPSTTILLILGICASLGVALEGAIPHRWDRGAPAKLFGFVIVAVLTVALWSVLNERRPFLLIAPTVAGALRLGTSEERASILLTAVRRIGFTGTALTVMFMPLFVFLPGSGPSTVQWTRKSPDGRWEVRLVEHGGTSYIDEELVLVPIGLATLDPFAYPSISLGMMAMDDGFVTMGWRDDRTLVVYARPTSSVAPTLVPNRHVNVVVRNLPPAPKPTPGTSILTALTRSR